MSSTRISDERATASPATVAAVDMKLEVVVLGVSDVDRQIARSFQFCRLRILETWLN